MKTNATPTGYILHQDSEIVVIATLESENRKTGNMIQVWILVEGVSPVEAVKTGVDAIVCGDCQHRGNGFADRSCYVDIGRAPSSVYCAYVKGSYSYLPKSHYGDVFSDRAVRFGAYGDPTLIPLDIVRWIVFLCNGSTGYTHQWTNSKFAPYREYIMASVDSIKEFHAAKLQNWRTFRVRSNDAIQSSEIVCPASDEGGKRTTCERCKLCSGSSVNDRRKDICITVHGTGSKNFIKLTDVK